MVMRVLEINDLAVSNRYTIESLLVHYTIQNTHECVDDYRLELQRSHTSEGDYDILSLDILGNIYYEDYSVNLLNDNIEYYYRIKIIHKNSGAYSFSNVARFVTSPMENISFWLKWTYDKYLRDVVTGDGYFLLKKKHTGQLCENYDDIRGGCRNSRCTTCWGTGFTGGYYPPIPIAFSYIGPGNRQEQPDRAGFINNDLPNQLWTSSYPILDVGDLIVGRLASGGRYRVTSVTRVAKNEFIVSQRFTMQELSPTDLVQRLEIKDTQTGHIEVQREYDTWSF